LHGEDRHAAFPKTLSIPASSQFTASPSFHYANKFEKRACYFVEISKLVSVAKRHFKNMEIQAARGEQSLRAARFFGSIAE
jgi:hypothetical protein